MGKRSEDMGRVIRAALSADAESFSDRELLRRFADDADQEAFAVLVRRYTEMVLGVCRRAVPTVQDAEDATQATFLVLARKARSQRWQASIANWLYTTARRVARDARLSAERRARREGKAARPEAVSPGNRMTGRELLAVLDEELERLPARYREPLVLCYLQGLTRDEAAGRLGVPLATVKTRLERGRKRLGDALARRGCTLGVGLTALMVNPLSASASGATLGRSILASVSGTPPEAVAKLATGTTVNGVHKSLMAALLLVGVTVLGMAGSSVELTTASAAVTQPVGTDDSEPTEATTIRVRILAPDGDPVPGAKLFLCGDGQPGEGLGVSDPDGRFRLSKPADRRWVSVAATGEGYGIAFAPLDDRDRADELILRLVPDNTIRGRVLDTEGKPVAGAAISVEAVTDYPDFSPESFVEQWRVRAPVAGMPGGGVHLKQPGVIAAPRTDRDGRFTLRGIGKDRVVELRVSGGGVADGHFWVVNRPGFDVAEANKPGTTFDPGEPRVGLRWLLYPPGFTLIAEPGKAIRGVVKDRDTGEPRAGVKVALTRGRDRRLLYPFVSATTDAEGRYEIRGARKDEEYMLEVYADVEAGYPPCQVTVPDTDGYTPVTADIDVAKGVVVTGRVFDRTTGKPLPAVVGARVPLGGNEFTDTFPESRFSASGGTYVVFTNAEGRFRLVSAPGRVNFTCRIDSRELPGGHLEALKYRPTGGDPASWQGYAREIPLDPAGGEFRQDIEFEQPDARTVTIRDVEGRPLDGVSVTGILPEVSSRPVWQLRADHCPAYGIEPGEVRVMAFHHPERNLTGVLRLEHDSKDTVVRLMPPGSLAGRLFGEDGKPLAGVTIGMEYREPMADILHEHTHRGKPAVTDEAGRFRVDGVIPGVEFDLGFRRGERRFVPVKPFDAVIVEKAGGSLDLGDLFLRPKESE